MRLVGPATQGQHASGPRVPGRLRHLHRRQRHRPEDQRWCARRPIMSRDLCLWGPGCQEQGRNGPSLSGLMQDVTAERPACLLGTPLYITNDVAREGRCDVLAVCC